MKRISLNNLPKRLEKYRDRIVDVSDWRKPGAGEDGEPIMIELEEGWHSDDHCHAVVEHTIDAVVDHFRRYVVYGESCGNKMCCEWCGDRPLDKDTAIKSQGRLLNEGVQ